MDKADIVLKEIQSILEDDADLCNFSRYMDYGKIVNNEYKWESRKTEFNNNGLINYTQCIRFVSDINNTFFEGFNKLCYQSKYYNSQSDLNSLYMIADYRREPNIRRSLNNIYKDLQSIMVNLDCNYCINGSSLTALDFICKNTVPTDSERRFITDIDSNVCKLIFIGQKCYLLALIDYNHITYVSLKKFVNIYDKDVEEGKPTFKLIVKKFFKLLEHCNIYFLKINMAQYYKNALTYHILRDIVDMHITLDKRICLEKLDDFKFDIDDDVNNTIKNRVDDALEKLIVKKLNACNFISNINIPSIIAGVRSSMTNANAHMVEKAYRNGMMLNSIFAKCGWNILRDNDLSKNGIESKYVDVGFREGHIYIYKEVNIIPKIAYVGNHSRNADGVGTYRILRPFVCREGKRIHHGELVNFTYPYNIHILYLDITDGKLYCDGRHPNVSNGNVCMGDLSGKVTFNNCDEKGVVELLGSCESLLKCINYTSAYNTDYEHIFLDNNNSTDYNGVEVENEETDVSRDSVKDLESIDTSDVEEIDELEFVNNETTGDGTTQRIHGPNVSNEHQTSSIDIINESSDDFIEDEEDETVS